MNRLLRLREFLKSDPELRQHSTQRGFAELLDYSTSMIRHLEQNGLPPSLKLARAAQRKIGVHPEWLLGADADSLPDPITSDGTPLTIEAVKSRLRRLPGHYLKNMPKVRISNLKDMADPILKAVKDAVEEDLRHEDLTLIARLLEVLNERNRRLEG